MFASLPPLAIVALMQFKVITPIVMFAAEANVWTIGSSESVASAGASSV